MKSRILCKNGLKVVDLNRRKAIHERCLNCSGWIPGEVKNCPHHDCPLHLYRTGKGNQDSKARAKAIRRYCLWCMNGKCSEVKKCVSTHCPLYPYRMKGVESSVEIDFEMKNDHIEPRTEAKAESEYLGLGNERKAPIGASICEISKKEVSA